MTRLECVEQRDGIRMFQDPKCWIDLFNCSFWLVHCCTSHVSVLYVKGVKMSSCHHSLSVSFSLSVSLCLSLSVSVSLSRSLCLFVPVSLSLSLSLSVCLSICLSPSLSLSLSVSLCQIFAKVPEVDLQCSGSEIHFHLCVDSCQILRDLLLYLSRNGDIQQQTVPLEHQAVTEPDVANENQASLVGTCTCKWVRLT